MHTEACREVLTLTIDNRKLVFAGSEAEMMAWKHAIESKLACIFYLKGHQKASTDPKASVLKFLNSDVTEYSFFKAEFGSTPPSANTLEFGTLDCRCLAPAISYRSGLKMLDFSNCLMTDEAFEILTGAFELNPRITHLNLSNNRITDAGIFHLVKRFSPSARGSAGSVAAVDFSLTTLILVSLHRCRISEEGGLALATALTSRATSESPLSFPLLELSGNELGDEFAEALTESLNDLNVKSLDLSKNKVNNSHFKYTTVLLFTHSFFHQIGDYGAKVLAESISSSETLESIRVEGNPFTTEGLQQLSRAALVARTVTSCHISDQLRLEKNVLDAVRLVGDTIFRPS